MDDSQAIHRLKRGDIDRLEVLVARHQIRAVETAFLVAQDLALAEDVVDTCRLEELIIKATSVEDQVEFDQLRATIDSPLAALPAGQRSAIVQRYYLQMSEKEMAQTLKTPPSRPRADWPSLYIKLSYTTARRLGPTQLLPPRVLLQLSPLS
jgi:DNA-directed RNA polymerase specialized sigma24 family protein